MVPNIGPVLGKNLISYCGSAEAVFEEKKPALSKIPGIGPMKAQDILDAEVLSHAEAEIKFLEKNEIKPLFYLDEAYPRRLVHYDYCPIMLYYKGNANLNPHRTVAIVGTRKPTEQGKIITEKIVEQLKQYDVHIISGLAYGVDGCAHKKAVEQSMYTVGVMGNGHDNIYPSEHRDLARKMIKHGGLITEFCSETKPDRANFPMRNRVIAAMSDAVIVIESKESGGSIITAEFANEYNKDVFAIPGRPSDISSKGCNALIKKTKAHLMESVEDLVYIMRWDDADKKKTVQTSLFFDLTDEEQKIIDFIRHKKEASVDSIIYELNLPSSTISSQLLGLEFKGLVRSLPGSRYILV
jgi:DNA processing protein